MITPPPYGSLLSLNASQKMKCFRCVGVCVVASLSLTFAACSKTPAAQGKAKVAFVSNNAFDFWTIAEAGCRQAEQDLGNVEVVFRKPPNGTAADQKEIIDTLVTQGVKAIAISVIDPKNQSKFLDRIAEKVPLITQDNDAPDSKRLCYIGTDNYEAGKAAGRLVKEAMPEGGTIAIFVGMIEPLNARQRRQGVLDELAGKKDADGPMYGKYKLHGSQFTDGTDTRRAKENAVNVLNALQGEKDVCLVGLWAYNPPAMLSAWKDFNGPNKKSVRLVGFDENAETLKGVEDGQIYGTIVQNPFGFGYESVKLMAALAKGDKSSLPADGIRFVPHRVITKDGGPGKARVTDFKAELDRLLGKTA
jgi:ribose transport system substrate-binding protein